MSVFREAATRLVSLARTTPIERVCLERCYGRIAAEAIPADIALPPWTNASMDGYAVHGDAVRGASVAAPITLRVTQRITPGEFPLAPISRDEAARVFTGSAVPDGCDTVVRQEDTGASGDQVTVTHDRDVGRNVRRAGSDIARGSVAIPQGSVIDSGALAILVASGIRAIAVHASPRVAIVATGDELAGHGDTAAVMAGRKLADVNSPVLRELVLRAGGNVVTGSIARDTKVALRDAVVAQTDAELLLTAGSVSVGDHDHVPAVMRELGAEIVFRRLPIRPGGPVTCAVLGTGQVWLALPGNPVSAMVTFELLARPLIRAMLGDSRPLPPSFQVVLQDAVTAEPSLELALRVRFTPGEDHGFPVVMLTGAQGSGMLHGMRGADALLVVPAGSGEHAARSRFSAVPIARP